MTDTTHECPASTCTARVPRSQLACKEHWKQISKPARDEVYAAYKSGDLGRHVTAMHAAIAELP